MCGRLLGFRYVRVRCPLEEAMVRYGRWVGRLIRQYLRDEQDPSADVDAGEARPPRAGLALDPPGRLVAGGGLFTHPRSD
jgi:hypothetical protein